MLLLVVVYCGLLIKFDSKSGFFGSASSILALGTITKSVFATEYYE